MKKILLLAFCLTFSVAIKAQLALAKLNGATSTPISDGQVFTYNTTNESVATLYYKIINQYSVPINVKIEVVSINNADGTSVQFCYYPTCKFSITAGSLYPPTGAINIPASSETSSTGFNFWNNNSGNGVNYPIDYVFKFMRVDSFDNPIGNTITITYRYDPNAIMAVSDAKPQNTQFAQLVSTVINDKIGFVSKEDFDYSLYDMSGSLVAKGSQKRGETSIDASYLQKGNYIIQMQSKKGDIVKIKVLK